MLLRTLSAIGAVLFLPLGLCAQTPLFGPEIPDFYVPAGCTGVFGDVACPSLFADWVEDLYGRQITGDCQASPLLYCPTNPNTRGQMAVFLVKTFALVLYGP